MIWRRIAKFFWSMPSLARLVLMFFYFNSISGDLAALITIKILQPKPENLTSCFLWTELIFLALGLVFITLSRRSYRKQDREALAQLEQAQLNYFPADKVPDTMRVFAALQNLESTAGQDSQSIIDVVIFASKLIPTNPWGRKIKPRKPRTGAVIRGLTWNFGTVEIVHSKAEKKKESELEPEADLKYRVGCYKLWRSLTAVFFQHFQNAEMETCVELTELYRGYMILFDRGTFSPLGFAKIGTRQVFDSERGSFIQVVAKFVAGVKDGEEMVLLTFTAPNSDPDLGLRA